MITRVLDEAGNVLHDCEKTGCTVSWDGYAITDQDIPTAPTEANPAPSGETPVAAGEQLPGATDPDARTWNVQGKIAKMQQEPADS